MALLSLSRDLWDPYSVLDVYPNASNFTCVGIASTTRARCRWSYNTEQLDRSQRATAIEDLEFMSRMQPSDVTREALASLARNTLCRDYHQRQADAKIAEWKARIDNYHYEHSERLALANDIRQLQHELDTTKQMQNDIAEASDASKKELTKMRQELHERTAQVLASKDHCSRLQRENKELSVGFGDFRLKVEQLQNSIATHNRQLKEEQEANSRGVTMLKQQLTDSRTKTTALEGQLRDRNANFLSKLVASSKKEADSGREIAGLSKKLEEASAASEAKVKKGEEEADDLRRQLKEANAVSEAKAKKSDKEAEDLRRQLEDYSEDTQRLRQEIDKMKSKKPAQSWIER